MRGRCGTRRGAALALHRPPQCDCVPRWDIRADPGPHPARMMLAERVPPGGQGPAPTWLEAKRGGTGSRMGQLRGAAESPAQGR